MAGHMLEKRVIGAQLALARRLRRMPAIGPI
jgi:hypothetical protein